MLINRKYGNQTRFAEAIGVPPTTIRRALQEGFYRTSFGSVNKIRQGLGLSFDQLVGVFPVNQSYPTAVVSKKARELYNLYLSTPDAQPAIDSLLGYSVPTMEHTIKERISRYGCQRKFAEAIGLPPTTLNDILIRGLKTASVANMCRISSGLNLTLDEIAGCAKQRTFDAIEANKFYALYEKYPNAQPAIKMLLKMK